MLPKTILVTNKTNIRYLCGFSGSRGYVVLLGKKKFLLTDGRYVQEAKSQMRRPWRVLDITDGLEKVLPRFLKKHRVKKMGIEGNSITFALYKKIKKYSARARLVDIENAISERRIKKTSKELGFIQHSQRINEKVFLHVKKMLKVGMTEKEIAWRIESTGREFGAEDVSFKPIVAIGVGSACPHHKNGARKLKKGDIVLIDMGFSYKGYCSDMTRMIFTASPTLKQKDVYGAVLAAQETAIKAIKAGVRGNKIYELALGVLKKGGYGDFFTHGLGHGIGMEIHELPNLSQKYDKKLPAGCIVTVEPGIYLPGRFGVRIEDMVVVGNTGTKNLTRVPKSIQSSIIKLK